MKETIQKISKKIDAKDFSFSRLEKDYILYYPELKNKLVKVFNKEVIKWNQDFFNFFTEEFVDELDEKLNDFAIYNVLNGKVQFSDAINALSNYDYYQNYFKDPKVFQPLKEPLYKELPKTDRKIVSKEVLITLFNEGKYELISKIKGKVQLYKIQLINSFLHDFLEKYPFEKYGFPHVLDNHVEDFFSKAQFMDARSLSILAKQVNSPNNLVAINKKSEINKTLNSLAKTKIYDKDFLDNFDADDINIISVLSEDEQKKFKKYLEDNNYYYLENKFDFKTITKIIENIKTDDNTYRSVRYLFLENQMDSLINYDEILDSFLEKDDILPILIIDINDSERQTKYINKIISKLNNENIKKQINENVILLKDNIELYKACLNNNIFEEIPIWEGLFKDNPQIEDDIYKALLDLKTKLVLIPNFLSAEESNILFELAYKSKNFNSLGLFFEKVDHEKYEDEIIDLIKTNDDFVSYLIHHDADILEFNKKLLEKTAINIINRNDIYSYWVLEKIKNDDLFDPVLNDIKLLKNLLITIAIIL